MYCNFPLQLLTLAFLKEIYPFDKYLAVLVASCHSVNGHFSSSAEYLLSYTPLEIPQGAGYSTGVQYNSDRVVLRLKLEALSEATHGYFPVSSVARRNRMQFDSD